MSNIFFVGRGTKIYQYWARNGSENWGLCCKNWKEHSFVSGNACETIAENWSDQHDKLDSIQKGNCYKQRTKIVRNY